MRPTPGSTTGQDPGASATTFFFFSLPNFPFSQHACLIVLFFSFWYRNRHHTVNQRCLPVEVTRTRCRNSFLNKFTIIRPPNQWIATRTGRRKVMLLPKGWKLTKVSLLVSFTITYLPRGCMQSVELLCC